MQHQAGRARCGGDLDRVRDGLVALRDAFAAAVRDPGRRRDALGPMRAAAHDLKRQGATVGCDLIAGIASSLAELLRDRTEIGDAGMRIAKLHIDALAIVFDHDLKGDGGAHGRRLLERLSGLVASAAA